MRSLGYHHTEETKRKISVAHIGIVPSEETRAKLSIINRKRWEDPEYRKKVVRGKKADLKETKRLYLEEKLSTNEIGERLGVGNSTVSRYLGELGVKARRYHTEAAKAKMSTSQSVRMKARWQDPAYREKTIAALMKALHIKPNHIELALQDVLDRHFPNTWKYVGDGQLIIGGKCPDFVNINGKKEVIELFGTYWHDLFDVARKKEHFAQYGFRVAIIWEDELKDEERLIRVLEGKFAAIMGGRG